MHLRTTVHARLRMLQHPIARCAAIAGAVLSANAPLPAQPLWSIRADAENAPVTHAGVSVLSGSDVLVYDEDAGRIVRMDRTGKLAQRIGAKGSGPGEFRSVSWMGLGANDSLYVWDGALRRLSIFSSAGTFVRAESPEHGMARPAVFGRLRDGRWLVVTHSERDVRESGVDLVETILHVGIARTVREAPTPLTTSPSKRMVTVRSGDLWHSRELPAMDMGYLAACEHGFLVGSGARRDVRAYDATGTLLTTIRAIREPGVITGASRTSTIEGWAGVRQGAGAPPTDPAMAASFAKAFDAVIPAKMHFTEQYAFGTDRSLWIAPNGPVINWQMLGDDGAARPQLMLSKDISLSAVSADYIVGRFYGDDERIELWARPSAFRGKTSSVPASLGTCTGALVQ